MAKIYGEAFSGTETRKLAPGTSHDAGVRRYRNKVDLAVEGGGTANSFPCGKVREGSCIEGAKLSSTANCSGINFTVGTDADNAKYALAVAGPAAGATVTFAIKPAMLAMDPLATPELVEFYPSGNVPASGILVGSILASHR